MRAHSIGLVALLLAAACGGDTTEPAGSVPYVGAFASATESGTLSFAVGSTANSSASGKMVLLNGATTSLSGSYTASSGAVSLSGGGFKFTGTVAGANVSGSYTSSKSSTPGTMTADAQGSAADTTKFFCGTYVTEDEYGWLNLVVSSTGVVTGFAVSGIGGIGSGGASATMSGTLSGSTLTATSNAGAPVAGVLSADGVTITGTYRPGGSATGSFSAGSTWCGTSTGITSLTSAGGYWASALGLSTTLNVVLTQNGSSVGGTGAIHVTTIAGYTGDRFKVLSGSFSSQSLSFTAQLGANPVGDGTFYYGSLSFTGTVTNGTSATGTLTYTPPQTKTQSFATQTLTGFTISR